MFHVQTLLLNSGYLNSRVGGLNQPDNRSNSIKHILSFDILPGWDLFSPSGFLTCMKQLSCLSSCRLRRLCFCQTRRDQLLCRSAAFLFCSPTRRPLWAAHWQAGTAGPTFRSSCSKSYFWLFTLKHARLWTWRNSDHELQLRRKKRLIKIHNLRRKPVCLKLFIEKKSLFHVHISSRVSSCR